MRGTPTQAAASRPSRGCDRRVDVHHVEAPRAGTGAPAPPTRARRRSGSCCAPAARSRRGGRARATASTSAPSAHAATTSWPAARSASISGSRKWYSVKSTLQSWQIFTARSSGVALTRSGNRGNDAGLRRRVEIGVDRQAEHRARAALGQHQRRRARSGNRRKRVAGSRRADSRSRWQCRRHAKCAASPSRSSTRTV